MKIKLKESFKFIFEIIVFIVVVCSAIFYGLYYKVNDIKDAEKAELTINKIIKLRTALEKYQEIAGHYPDLTKNEEVKSNLFILDYISEKGEKISFGDIYGQQNIDLTELTTNLEENNRIYPVTVFKNLTLNGGWNYNKRTGEIRANLPENIYGQNIIWTEE
ncbi:MAG: hypothetical protein ACRC6A_00800 [Fusobacteriaceae bacterium]